MSLRDFNALPPGDFVDLPGRGTTYVRRLAGPPGAPTIVLLHGWTATGGINWASAMEPLSHHFNVIAMDERGHGRGIKPDRFRLTDCADDVAALLDVLHVDRAIVCGYSMGGPIAQLTAHRHPEKVSGMILCSTSGSFPQTIPVALPMHLWDHILSLVPKRLQRTILPLADRGAYRNVPLLDEVGRSNMRNLMEAGEELAVYDAWPWLQTITCPSAVVVTTRDQLVPPLLQEMQAWALPNATMYKVNSPAGHAVAGFDSAQWVKTVMRAADSVQSRVATIERREASGPDLGAAA